jgi:hypothetical protein
MKGRNGETENGRLKDLETCFWAIRNLHKPSFRILGARGEGIPSPELMPL